MTHAREKTAAAIYSLQELRESGFAYVGKTAEVRTSAGRVGMAVETPGDVRVAEFKLDRPAAEAMALVRGKGYAARHALPKKRLTLLGISFSSERRTIVEEG